MNSEIIKQAKSLFKRILRRDLRKLPVIKFDGVASTAIKIGSQTFTIKSVMIDHDYFGVTAATIHLIETIELLEHPNCRCYTSSLDDKRREGECEEDHE